MAPKITVLIPTFDRAQYLPECLDSIFAQSLAPFQVLVVNDGSSDRTQEVLKPYMKRIDYLKASQLGKPSAINHALDKVRGDYLWIFDDDDVALPDALERFVEPLEKHPECGFSHSTFYLTSRDPKTGKLGPDFDAMEIPDLNERGFLIPLLEWNFLGGAALFARSACYKKVGGFDPALLRSQDYEMAIRLARRFSAVKVEGGPTFRYTQHEGIRGARRDRFKGSVRKLKWLEYDQIFFRKLYNELPLIEYLPPGSGLAEKKRQALLQRMAIMAYKMLVPEVMSDLQALSQVEDQRVFSADEYAIIRSLITCPTYYDSDTTILDCQDFLEGVRKLATSSAAIRLLKTKIARAVFARIKSNFSFKETRYTRRLLARLYL